MTESIDATAGDPAARAAIERGLAHDRRVIRRLIVGTIALWLIVLAAVGYLLFTYFLRVVPRIDVMMAAEPAASSRLESWTATLTIALAWGVAIVVVLIGLLSLATMATVALVFASRRATLRQINLSLLLISAQLRELQAARTADVTPPPAGPPRAA